MEILTDDFATIRLVAAGADRIQEDMRRDVQFHLSQVDNTLYQMGRNGLPVHRRVAAYPAASST